MMLIRLFYKEIIWDNHNRIFIRFFFFKEKVKELIRG